jgi:uncharacterized membrane protein
VALLIRWVHVLSAITWVGGMLFIALVLVPTARALGVAVRRLTEAHRVQAVRLPDGEIAHENVVVLLDRAGRAAFTYRGLAHPETRIQADLTRLLAERG